MFQKQINLKRWKCWWKWFTTSKSTFFKRFGSERLRNM